MNRKTLWIIIGSVVTLLILVLGGLLVNNYYKTKRATKDKEAASAVATDFSLAWFNYSDQTSVSYLAKIKPFMTEEFYSATEYINTQRPQDFIGQLPMTATIISHSIRDHNKALATVEVGLETQEEKSAKNNSRVVVTLLKLNSEWKVSNFE